MSDKSLRVGVIGAAKIAEMRHIPEYLSNKNVELVARDWRSDRSPIKINRRWFD